MSIASQILKTFGKDLAAHVLKQYPKLLEKDADELKKHCRVCGERIQKNPEYVLSRRFRCTKCGHRTHVHCADGDPARKVCASCGNNPDQGRAEPSRRATAPRKSGSKKPRAKAT